MEYHHWSALYSLNHRRFCPEEWFPEDKVLKATCLFHSDTSEHRRWNRSTLWVWNRLAAWLYLAKNWLLTLERQNSIFLPSQVTAFPLDRQIFYQCPLLLETRAPETLPVWNDHRTLKFYWLILRWPYKCPVIDPFWSVHQNEKSRNRWLWL